MIMKTLTKAPVIFDFDGTLADSFDVFIECLEIILNRQNNLSTAEIKELRGLSTRQVMSRLKIKKWQLPKLVTKGRALMATRIKEIELFSGIDKCLSEVAQNHPIYMLSTNDKSSIEYVLRKYGLDKYVIDIQAGAGMLNKKKRLLKLAKKHKLKVNDCIYVGDEIRDIEAASAINMKSIAVSWGFSTKDALKSANPSRLVTSPAGLKSAIDSLSR